ncbi:Vacuolar protein sorting-associated protein 17 [Candida viswanathii]|uniref:Vacuolar protein sorting-associated protein 17 n=1 Tax=Candida viswanathii TaxID=5486 RepID=A0A367Y6C7_9ASCO|nr:Vacuolar protein sorting-associated protein 17 [Candida viswanathii]
MSSIGYPDDFENNNPFAEPTIAEHSNDTTTSVNDENDEPPIQPPQSSVGENDSQEEQQQQQEQNPDLLTEEELKKLLPERFTKKYSLNIQLIGIEKNKPGNPILKMNVEVKGLPRFRQSIYKEVRRTYNEVVKFNKYLTISNLEVFVPVIPSSSTSFPAGGEDEKKQLLNLWQEWLDRITSNPILIRDEEFVYFVESDFGYSVINSNRKSSVASGFMRKTLKQLAVPYDPYEELASFRPIIKEAYLICQRLYKALDRNSKTEKQLSIHIFDMANKLKVLSEFETTHPGMKNMWEKLGKVTQKQSDLTLVDSINEMATVGDGIQTLIDDFYEIKEALTNRHLIMRELIQAEANAATKHTSANRIKSRSSLDPIKVDEALRSLEYATKVQESLNLQVKRISGEMLFERKEVLEYTEKKFQRLMKTYTLHKVDHHRKILKNLESIRLDVRSVDEKGGLSRLNRDNLSNLKHNLTQSQSSQGDSWSSRTFRSLEKEEEENESRKQDESVLQTDVVDPKNAASLLGVATF